MTGHALGAACGEDDQKLICYESRNQRVRLACLLNGDVRTEARMRVVTIERFRRKDVGRR